jgi:undecaprenyl diphosphate synthase
MSARTDGPAHVAIIMDGNRRWARSRNLPAIEGHRRGIVALREVLQAAKDEGVKHLTVYGFSTENWSREKNEISLLFELCVFFARSELAELQRNGVREALRSLQDATAGNTGVQLNLAVNYSSRLELERAVQAIARDVKAGTLAPDDVDEAKIASYLFTADLPDPDLLIRPGGEHRLSNFLLYQAAYTELVMSDVYWPDFGREEFGRALGEFRSRLRRFGT